jgi:hypothetical protein
MSPPCRPIPGRKEPQGSRRGGWRRREAIQSAWTRQCPPAGSDSQSAQPPRGNSTTSSHAGASSHPVPCRGRPPPRVEGPICKVEGGLGCKVRGNRDGSIPAESSACVAREVPAKTRSTESPKRPSEANAPFDSRLAFIARQGHPRSADCTGLPCRDRRARIAGNTGSLAPLPGQPGLPKAPTEIPPPRGGQRRNSGGKRGRSPRSGGAKDDRRGEATARTGEQSQSLPAGVVGSSRILGFHHCVAARFQTSCLNT